MARIFFAYLLHEIPLEPTYFCKVGITSFPIMRFITLQEGNPRQLNVWKHVVRDSEMPGLPFPTRTLAMDFEFNLLFALGQRGNRLKRTYKFENSRPIAREWVAGVEPEEIWLHMLSFYEEYISIHRRDFENSEEWCKLMSSY